MKKAIYWFRRDLRIADNTALARACDEAEEVVPVYVFDPRILKHSDTGTRRVALLLECLRKLDDALRRLGGGLVFVQGDPVEELPRLSGQIRAEAIYWNKRPEPRERRLESEIEKKCDKIGVAAISCEDSMIVPPDVVLKKNGEPYLVFTPYSKVWRQAPKKTPLGGITRNCFSSKLRGDVPTLKDLEMSCDVPLPEAGEMAARKEMETFVSTSISRYKSSRDIPFLEGTSRLSHHLSFGTISPRVIYEKAREKMNKSKESPEEIDTFVNELIWRDFYRMILWHYPYVAKGAFKKDLDGIEWENNKMWFEKWCEGRTGFPIVDAAMRQLNQTGWMHNRLRMIVASFLTKDLLVDWKWGESYFMRQLFDADLAANNGGWQWSAGTGTDAQPYFRIFNPVSQAEKYDPDGRFIQRYVPEAMSRAYPPPVVEHRVQRAKALLMYRRMK